MPIFPEPPNMDRAALEVGHITFHWAMLEDVVSSFTVHLLSIEPDSQVAHILDGNIDFRSKLQVARGLAYLYHFDKDWLTTALALLDHIDNYLRPRRNEIIHAQWFHPKGKIERRTRRTKIQRPQAFKLALETEQVVPVKIDDLRRLRRDMQETWAGMLPVFWYTCDTDGLLSPTEKDVISFKKYLRWAGLGNPLRNVNAVRKRQLKKPLSRPR